MHGGRVLTTSIGNRRKSVGTPAAHQRPPRTLNPNPCTLNPTLTDALQVRELAAAAAQQRDDDAVVDGDERDDGDGVEQCQAGAGDDEAAAEHDAIHARALHHEEAAHLRAGAGHTEVGAAQPLQGAAAMQTLMQEEVLVQTGHLKQCWGGRGLCRHVA